jgi:hypothetical protein
VEESRSCSTGYTGTQTRTKTTSCPSGAYGAPTVTYSTWTGTCTATCTTSETTTSSACGTGYTGTKYTTTKSLCPSGTSSTVDTSGCGCANGATDYPKCTPTDPACTPTSTTTSSACGSGYTGLKYTTVKTQCPTGSSTSVDTSACGCANGGTNYPTCTPPAVSCPSGTQNEWSTGTHLFCQAGNDSVPSGSLSSKCGGAAIVYEVDVLKKSSGAQRAGYTCSIGSTTLYSYSGSKLTLP